MPARISRVVRIWNRPSLNDLLPGGFAKCEALMNPLSSRDVFLTVAIMSATFLTEVGLFILVGML